MAANRIRISPKRYKRVAGRLFEAGAILRIPEDVSVVVAAQMLRSGEAEEVIARRRAPSVAPLK